MKGTALLLAVLAVTLGIGASTTTDPYEIYSRARALWASQQYPELIAYTVRITVADRRGQKTSHYHEMYDAVRNRVFFVGVSDEEHDNPHFPDGTNLSVVPTHGILKFLAQKVHVGRPEDAVDYLGVPILTPTYSFGIAAQLPSAVATRRDQKALVEEIRQELNDPMPPEKATLLERQNGEIPEIAHVVTNERAYEISLVGKEPVEGREAYHLALRPLQPSNRHRLREVWVDAENFTTVKVLAQGNFRDEGVPWLVTFTKIGDATYITSETAQRPIAAGRHVYTNASVTFEGIAPVPRDSLLWRAPATTGNLLVEPVGEP